VTGVEREESEPGDAARTALDVLLFLPRIATELFFVTTGAAADLIEQEQVVPRIRDMTVPSEGEVRIFPTAFVETGSGPNVGVRVIGRARGVGTTARAGIGGAHDLVVESRLKLASIDPLPFAIGLEALHDERSSLGYLGLGQEPESDPRNRFRIGTPALSASYRERRERLIATAGMRAGTNVELLASTSFSRRHVLDSPAADANQIDDVFEPGSVPGARGVTHVVLSELALRLDTRESRGGPARGILLETYAGRGDGVRGTSVRYVRSGGRAAAFIPIVESDNVLSPKLVLDELDALRGPVPFVELPRQPDFRGFDNRRDYVSLVGSLDYRWTVMRYLAARIFTDAATVAPRIAELELGHLRWVGGFGFDVFSSRTQLGSLAISAGPEGASFFFSFGVASGFGDRQHRS
jgi:hypothetical protein